MSSLLTFFAGVVIVGILLSLAIMFAPKGWRTVIANALAGVPLVGTYVGEIVGQVANIDLTQYLDNITLAKGITLGMIVMNIILRAATDTAMGKKA